MKFLYALVAQRFQERPLTRLQDTNMTVFGQNLTETLLHLETVAGTLALAS